MTTDDAVKLIRGPQGTTVTLTVMRPSEKDAAKKIFNVTVTRAAVNIPSVSSKVIIDGKKTLGYIQISIIGQDTETALEKEIIDLQKQHLDGIILDLRGNGGGFLDIGVQVASHFIPTGKTVVTSRYRLSGDNQVYTATGSGEFVGMPTVVLVDGLTASAGEIIAAALSEDDGAKIVGTQTFGKGSIQTVAPRGAGEAIKYTIGKWFTPNNENVDTTGIKPDVVIPFDTGAYTKSAVDNQLQTAEAQAIKLMK